MKMRMRGLLFVIASFLWVGLCEDLGTGFWNLLQREGRVNSNYYDTVGPGSRSHAATWNDGVGNFWLYGGLGYNSSCSSLEILGDMWFYNSSSSGWQVVSFLLASQPGPGLLAGATTWKAGNNLFMFSGTSQMGHYDYTNNELSKPDNAVLWQYYIPSNTWSVFNSTPIAPMFAPHGYPGARLAPSSWVYNNQLYLFGGLNALGALSRDLWSCDLNSGNWEYFSGIDGTNCEPVNDIPSCRFGAAVSANTADVIYLIGGSGATATMSRSYGLIDVWLFTPGSVTNWAKKSDLTIGRSFASAAPFSNGFVIYGGRSDNGILGDEWTYDSITGRQTISSPITPPPRYSSSTSYGFIYGGFGHMIGSVGALADLWMKIASTWTLVRGRNTSPQVPTQTLIEPSPSSREGAMTWADDGGNLWLFGGQSDSVCGQARMLSDLWKYNPIKESWEVKSTPSETPPARKLASIWQDKAGSVWMYGGVITYPNGSLTALCDMWKFSNGDWVRVLECGQPGGIFNAQFWIYNNQFYMWGGQTVATNSAVQTYQLWKFLGNLPIWEMVPLATPFRDIIYYPTILSPASWQVGNMVYVFGGTHNSVYTNELWQMDLTSRLWQQIERSGSTPYPPRGEVPTTWVDAIGNLWMLNDGIAWSFNINNKVWAEHHTTIVGPKNSAGLTVNWQNAFVYAWGLETYEKSNALWRIDPCRYGNGGCLSDQVCTHLTSITGGISCINTHKVQPVAQFTLNHNLYDSIGRTIQLESENYTYSFAACVSVGLNLTGTSAEVTPEVWKKPFFDFTISFWLKFDLDLTLAYNTAIMGQRDCNNSSLGDYWGLYYKQGEIVFAYGSLSLSYPISPAALSLITINRSGDKFTLFVNGNNVGFDHYTGYIPSDGLIIGDSNCDDLAPPTSLVIDNLSLFNVPLEAENVPDCPNEIVVPVTQCATFTGYDEATFIIDSSFPIAHSPCLVFSAGKFQVVGNGVTFTCNLPECTLIQVNPSVSDVTIKDLVIVGADIVLNNVTNYLISEVEMQNYATAIEIIGGTGEICDSEFANFSTAIHATEDVQQLVIRNNTITNTNFPIRVSLPNEITSRTIISSNTITNTKVKAIRVDLASDLGNAYVTVEENEIRGGNMSSAIYIHSKSVQITLYANEISDIAAIDNDDFNVIDISAYTGVNLNSSHNSIRNIMTNCRAFSFASVLSDITSSATFAYDTFSYVTPSQAVCSGSFFQYSGIRLKNVRGYFLNSAIHGIAAPTLNASTVSTSQFVAAFELSESKLHIEDSKFEITAPSLTYCIDCYTTEGLAAYAVASVVGTNELDVMNTNITVIGGNSAMLVNVAATRSALGGNAALMYAERGSLVAQFDSVKSVSTGGNGVLPYESLGAIDCSHGSGYVNVSGALGEATYTETDSELLIAQGLDCFGAPVPCITQMCEPNGTCSVDGTCSCHDGYSPSNRSCIDTDECSPQAVNPCNGTSYCVNTPGSYSCIACPTGFQSISNVCTDVNECSGDINPCNSTTYCENKNGSYECIPCQSGYEQILNACTDINECSSNPCVNTSVCYNRPGFYQCTPCPSGFSPVDNVCTDVDECKKGLHNCDPLSNCTNTNGSYICGPCPKGYTKDKFEKCMDIDECKNVTNPPCKDGMCTNTNGSFTCNPCKPGYYLPTGSNTCIDTNECLIRNGGCDRHVVCQNTEGGFFCPPCPPQFNGSSYTTCNPLCGDKVCNASIGEDCVSCPSDCTEALCSKCGDGFCDANEDCKSCFADCSSTCVQKTCKGTPSCTGHGTCFDGLCACDKHWSGPDCSVSNVPVNVTSNTTAPVLSIVPISSPTSPSNSTVSSFDISISSIKEVNSSNGVISSYLMAEQNFTKNVSTNSNGPLWTFATVLENKAEITFYMQFFLENGFTKFANKTIQVAANTVKLNVKVKNWPFKSITNSLAIAIDAKSDGTQSQPCIESNTDSGGSLTWYTIKINGVIMYGKFTTNAVLDGRNRIVSFKLNSAAGYVTATVPHFWNEMDLDPNYSLLVGSEEDPDGCNVSNSKGGSNKVSVGMYIGIFCGVVGAAAIVAFAVFIYPRLRTRFMVKKHHDVELKHSASNSPILNHSSPPSTPRISTNLNTSSDGTGSTVVVHL